MFTLYVHLSLVTLVLLLFVWKYLIFITSLFLYYCHPSLVSTVDDFNGLCYSFYPLFFSSDQLAHYYYISSLPKILYLSCILLFNIFSDPFLLAVLLFFGSVSFEGKIFSWIPSVDIKIS